MSAPSTAEDRRQLLRIYLNDHLMGSAGGIQLARRCLQNNRNTPLAPFLEELLAEITEDRATLERLMAALGFPANPAKQVAAVAMELLGRLKLNGRLLGYSDLSRLIELEALHAGVNLKLRMWLALRHVAVVDPRLGVMDFDHLIERAESQLRRLEEHRLQAAERAFTAAGVGGAR